MRSRHRLARSLHHLAIASVRPAGRQTR
jgi:hypothetical protein